MVEVGLAEGIRGRVSRTNIVNPITDSSGTRLGFVVEWRDVTAELLQRQHDAENARRIEAISKAQAVIEFGMDGIIQGANDNFLNATGYTLAEIKGNHHSMFVDPVYRQSDEYKKFWEKLGRGEYEAAQYRRLGKNGREVWLQASYNPIFGPDGKPTKVVKYASDTTEHVLAAQALQQAVDDTVSSRSVSSSSSKPSRSVNHAIASS